MSAITFALLAASLGAPPTQLPDGKTLDTLSYSFSSGAAFGAGGHLSISADGKVHYSHETMPFTGSGGIVTRKEWAITKDEKADLFRKLVADGLLDIPDAKMPSGNHQLTVSSGKWQFNIKTNKVPDKVMAHLLPLLVKAHPLLWEERPERAKPEPPQKPVFTLLKYTFTPKPDGEEAFLSIKRDGSVIYTRQTHPTAPGGRKAIVHEQWTITAKDAAVLLDALAADGVFDLVDTHGGKFPNHHVFAQAGRWQTTLFPKEIPEKLLKHLHPLLKKADAEFWK